MRSWPDVFKNARQLKFGTIDYERLMGSGDISLATLMSVMNSKFKEDDSIRVEKIKGFYKAHGFWTEDSINTLPLVAQVVVPFPALCVSFDLMVERIFRERTKLLVKTVDKALKEHNYSLLNWWYFVKTLYPSIDNQILIQYSPINDFSFEDKESRAVNITNIQDLLNLSTRMGNIECMQMFQSQDHPSYSQDKLKDEWEKHKRSYEGMMWFKLQELFDPFSVKRKLRILSSLSYPFNTNDHDLISMFSKIDSQSWKESFEKNADKRIRKNLEDCINTTQLHDIVFYRVRSQSMPLRKIDQSKIFFLENIDFGQYQIRIPRSNHDLDYISSRLHNCVGRAGYFDKIEQGHIFIIEVLKNGQSYACLEYSKKRREIIQSKILKNQQFSDSSFLRYLEKVINESLYPSLFSKLKSLFKKQS